jgi:hypothetical protein
MMHPLFAVARPRSFFSYLDDAPFERPVAGMIGIAMRSRSLATTSDPFISGIW